MIMKKNLCKGIVVVFLGVFVIAGQVLAETATPAPKGFSGIFAPNNWRSSATSPNNRVDTTRAPMSITLDNNAPWVVSGPVFTFPNAPAEGAVSFSYNLSGAIPQCPGSYFSGNHTTPLSDGASSVTFQVTAGTAFGFGFNWKTTRENLVCNRITLTVSDFAFTPLAGTPTVSQVGVRSAPPVPSGMTVFCMAGPDSYDKTSCPVITHNGVAFWPFSYADNRSSIGLVGYYKNSQVGQQEITGVRYIWKVTVDAASKTVTFWGQAGATVQIPWSQLK